MMLLNVGTSLQSSLYWLYLLIFKCTYIIQFMLACESTSGFISNDYQNKISFISARLSIDSNVTLLLKQAAVRSLSCEVIPGKEGLVYFGDSARGHFLSNAFCLKDAQARGFHRWYSIVIYMKDKHLLLNSWPFFEKFMYKLIEDLQTKASQVFTQEQNMCSQRKLRLSGIKSNQSTTRSLVKLTGSPYVFTQLHLWFSWLLSAGAKRLEENTPMRMLNTKSYSSKVEIFDKKNNTNIKLDDFIWHLRKLRIIFGKCNFQKIIYSALIGRQIIVRGPKAFVGLLLNILKLFLPSSKSSFVRYDEKYKSRDTCSIIGLSLYAAVPKSCYNLLRLDIVPDQTCDYDYLINSNDDYDRYNFILKCENKLPEKLPTLLVKIDKALADDTLSDKVVWLHVYSLLEQWFHTAEVLKEANKKYSEMYYASLMHFLGIKEHDKNLIKFWTT